MQELCACYVIVPVPLREAPATEAFGSATGGTSTTSQRGPSCASRDKCDHGATVLGSSGPADVGNLRKQGAPPSSAIYVGSNVMDNKSLPPTVAAAETSCDAAGTCNFTTATTLRTCANREGTIKVAGTRLKTACTLESSCVGRHSVMAQPPSARSVNADCNVNVRHVRNTATAGPPYKQHMKRRRVQPNAQSATCLPMCRSPAADAQAEEDSWLVALEQALMASSDEDTMPTPPAVV